MGTRFNVSSYKDDEVSSAVLEDGKIELQYPSKGILGRSKVEMIPGEMAEYNPTTKDIVEKNVQVSQHVSWKDGYFIFQKVKIEDIAHKLSRYYNVDIVIDNDELAETTFSGYLDLTKPAIDVLTIMGYKLYSVEEENNTLHLRIL